MTANSFTSVSLDPALVLVCVDRRAAIHDAIPSTGVPVLDGALARRECRLTDAHDGGDHSVFIGTVLDLGRAPGGDALLFHGGRFHRLRPGTPSAPAEPATATTRE